MDTPYKTTIIKTLFSLIFLIGIFSISAYGQCVSGNCKQGKGVLVLGNGSRYVGEFSDGKKNGSGTMYYADGSAYKGEWENDLQQGRGEFSDVEGKITPGIWYKGNKVSSIETGSERSKGDIQPAQTGCISGDCQQGSGVFVHPGGALYVGQFRNGEIHGAGTCYYPDGSKYIGEWAHGFPQGKGTKLFLNGQKREGLWDRGQPVTDFGSLETKSSLQQTEHPILRTGCIKGNCEEGSGVFAYADGSRYEGTFSKGKPDGSGVLFYTDKTQYRGELKQGYLHGYGTMRYSNATEKTGYWQQGQYVGKMPVKNDGCIEGNCLEGVGTFVYSNGDIYKGSFQQGKPHGKGSVEYKSGDKYIGDFSRGVLQGEGTYYRKGEVFLNGMWENNQCVKPFTTTESSVASSETYKPTNTYTNPTKDVKIWAVLVGIANYNHMPVLRYTDDDAYRIYGFLKSPEGGAIPDEQIRILIDEDATRANIFKTLREVFQKAGSNDMVLFYFSGHGLKDALLPIDYDGFQNKLLHKDITLLFKQCPAAYKLCLADACHSGSLLSMKGAAVQNILAEYYRELGNAIPGTALIMSSKADETSLESSGLRQGVFTHFLIRGLKGEADTDQNKLVTVQELFAFVEANVRIYTGNRQSPLIQGNYDPRMPVSNIR